MSIQNYSTAGLLPPPPPTLPPPPYPVQYVRVSGGVPAGSGRTTLHAVLDYDDDEDEGRPPGSGGPHQPAEEFRGPILVKNGSVPVVPLYSYSSTYNNGTLVHIPVLWTALSLALGLEIRGDIIKGTPCIKRYHQLFCPTAGNSYPIERIELFIDENKALMKRMYGEFQLTSEYGPPGQEVYESDRRRRSGNGLGGSVSATAGFAGGGGSSYFNNKARSARQAGGGLRTPTVNSSSDTGRVDACQSKVEIVTPYWAANSAGKVRAIVNTQHFEQAVHQEVCSKVQTSRCSGDCGCEQKYKWHRLLAYDPDNDCKGIFMDWFLFPSCCVCRCNPTEFNSSTQPVTSRQRSN
ncbi:spaetzle domain-containing protein 3 [Rhodnius prolixus]